MNFKIFVFFQSVVACIKLFEIIVAYRADKCYYKKNARSHLDLVVDAILLNHWSKSRKNICRESVNPIVFGCDVQKHSRYAFFLGDVKGDIRRLTELEQ